jgi:hypothetical protein
MLATLEPTDPHKRHAIGHDESSLVVDVAEGLITLAFHDAVDAGDTDIIALAAYNPTVNGCNCLRERKHVDVDTKNIGARWIDLRHTCSPLDCFHSDQRFGEPEHAFVPDLCLWEKPTHFLLVQ